MNNTPKLPKGIMKMEIASKKEDTLKRLMKSMELYRQGEAADAIEFIVSRDIPGRCFLDNGVHVCLYSARNRVPDYRQRRQSQRRIHLCG